MNCLETPVVLRQILEQLSNRELLQLSLVNKQWNFEARSVLRDRRTLTAIIRSNQSCLILVDFAADLEQMRVVPFSGIHLVLSLQATPSFPNEVLDEAYKRILQRLPCRNFFVHFADEWEEYSQTPALELVTKILQDYCGVLEKLSLSFSWAQVNMPHFLDDLNFGRLKTLQFDVKERATADGSLGSFLKTLVSRAPNLAELFLKGSINFNENVLEGSSAVLVPCFAFNPLHERVCDSLVGALRPKHLQLRAHPRENVDVELLNRHVPMVLQASCSSLPKLYMDLLFAVPLMCYGICLENVTDLLIRIEDQTPAYLYLEPRISKIIKRFDFTRSFPKLSHVQIAHDCSRSFAPEQLSGFVERGHALLKETLPDRAVNIKELTFINDIPDSIIPFLAQMFPDVEKLAVNSRSVSFAFLRDHFRNLENLSQLPPK